MSQVRQAIFFSLVNSYSLQAVSFVTVAVLARLLTPKEIGLFAVATSIAFLASSIRSLGVSEYLIREKEITAEQVKSVVGVVLVMSWGLGAVLLAASPWIAEFYGEQDLTLVLCIITIPFFLAPFTAVPFALMAREMNFSHIFRVDFAGGLIGSVSNISLVAMGFSYYGLACGTVIGVVAEFLIITYYRPKSMEWMPSFRNMGEIFRIGMLISISKTLNTTSQNVTDLVLGRLATMDKVGLFSRGIGLILFLRNLIINSVGNVALPHLSQVHRDGESVKDAYLNAIVLVGAFAMPIFAVVNLSAYPMITALFGNQWTESTEIASILAIWAMLQSVHCFSSQALLTIGKERTIMWYDTLSFAVKLGLIIVAATISMTHVAWAIVLSGAFDLIVISCILYYAISLSPLQVFRAFAPNLIVAVSCWGAIKLLSLEVNFEETNSWLVILLIAAVAVPTWTLGLKLTSNKAWAIVVELCSHLLKVVSRKGSQGKGSQG
ncbi:MAG: hypothetical protein CMK83_07345 [Pseudomonadales bacterium]|uniref:lipopolysaccharide biosynthesis protein n=1 Tax=unclassified Ketobacter TaxID=2639109 RepID=UPI000C929E8E|nr:MULTISPECIES: lipopolysaccharide biosynthesis protein [unclassified Ketobacter]MAA58670.1 hypothetical protein [Pseudomonadales bacterium]MEC8813869.1 lipopolysaccharide biosynthesis protein [Pseudomonadota bacterium]HAG96663.1 hypothetical protein [Gammaproteobacteria bacterium]MAQ24021.1 hypothetical protein [Pseudomonadales bacterium]RLT87813.1 MAG: lipopolysaccharide biosynthesis protein [Ketobacter sp. GenoA1]|tara:strand:- start:20080 stop:21558 length:1479 start_codon:yes stop_codon:yes gene_type:complete